MPVCAVQCCHLEMGDSLTAEQWSLEPLVGVRIPVPQPDQIPGKLPGIFVIPFPRIRNIVILSGDVRYFAAAPIPL